MPTDTRAFAPNVVLGLGIAALGVTLLLDRLNLVEARELLAYWPVLLVLFGGSIVWQALRWRADEPLPRPMVSPGLIILLIIVGVIATRADFRRPNQTTTASTESAGVHAVLGSSRHVSLSSNFQGADMTSIMGGSVLDLRQTTIPDGGEAVIEVFALMGGLDLFVPKHWVIVTDVIPVMGAVEDRRTRVSTSTSRRREGDPDQTNQETPPATSAPPELTPAPMPEPAPSANPPRLVIRGFIMMGGLDIRL